VSATEPGSSLDGVDVVVLAGGRGRRLEPFTSMFPKPLVPIGEMPILEILLRQLERDGFRAATVSTGYLGELIEVYLATAHVSGALQVSTVREVEPLGTAGALSLHGGDGRDVLAVNGDVLTDLSFTSLVEAHRASGAAMTVATQVRRFPVELGVVEVGTGGVIEALTEKPVFDLECAIGVNVYGPPALAVARRGGPVAFDEVVRAMLDAGEKVVAHRFDGFWADVGRADDHERAQRELVERRVQLIPEPPS
jgi:NDP-sugar pyrophosphorylase family protein